MRNAFLAVLVLVSGCDRGQEPAGAVKGSSDRAKDFLCGMMVDRATALKTTHEGTVYYFCADECRLKFQADPKKYAVSCPCAKAGKKCSCDHCGDEKGVCDCG
jgi:YHS domain-containing protein